jgi:hypothetical protein
MDEDDSVLIYVNRRLNGLGEITFMIGAKFNQERTY